MTKNTRTSEPVEDNVNGVRLEDIASGTVKPVDLDYAAQWMALMAREIVSLRDTLRPLTSHDGPAGIGLRVQTLEICDAEGNLRGGFATIADGGIGLAMMDVDKTLRAILSLGDEGVQFHLFGAIEPDDNFEIQMFNDGEIYFKGWPSEINNMLSDFPAVALIAKLFGQVVGGLCGVEHLAPIEDDDDPEARDMFEKALARGNELRRRIEALEAVSVLDMFAGDTAS